MRRRYRQDPETGKLVEIRRNTRSDLYHIGGAFRSFRSPVDGTWVDSPKKLEEHNRRNDVAPMEHFQDEIDRRTKRKEAVYGAGHFDTQERIEALKLAYDLHSSNRSESDRRQILDNFIHHQQEIQHE